MDCASQTLEFLLTAKRDAKAAKRFFRKLLKASHTSPPRVIIVDKNAAYPSAFEDLHKEGQVPKACRLHQSKYLNDLVEQDHRAIKRLIRPMLGFQSLRTAWRTLRGIEMLHMIGKGQVLGVNRGNIQAQNRFMAELFRPSGLIAPAAGVSALRRFLYNRADFAAYLLLKDWQMT